MQPIRPIKSRRRGSILPVVALLMVALCGFAALAVETAEIAMIKVECQNAADAAALAGARTLDGSASQNYNLALNNARTVAGGNSTLGFSNTGQVAIVPFVASEIAVTLGTLHYDTSSKLFSPAYTLANGENYNLGQGDGQPGDEQHPLRRRRRRRSPGGPADDRRDLRRVAPAPGRGDHHRLLRLDE